MADTDIRRGSKKSILDARLNQFLGKTEKAADSDKLDGYHASAFAAASHEHSAADITSDTLPVARGGTGVTTTKDIALLSYPIGAIYISYSSTSPATLFGGTWSALPTGRFLRTGTGGATGGSDTHAHTTAAMTLAISQIPGHSHIQQWTGYNFLETLTLKLGNGGLPGTATSGNEMSPGTYSGNGAAIPTKDAGGGGSHEHGNTGSASNVPAYYEVYAWRRTA